MRLSPFIHNTFKQGFKLSLSAHTPRAYTGKSYQDMRADRKYISPVYSHYYKEPFFPVQGYREFLYDQNGREYIDLIGGISCMNVGHSHPRITRIYEEEGPKLMNLSSHYVNEYQGTYAEKLCKQLGEGFDTVFFFNSGSQANDFAYNMAKAYTKNNTVVSLRNGYHGTAGYAYSLTGIGTWNTSLSKANALQRLAWPNFYKNPHLSIDSLIADAQEQLDSSTNGRVAGVWLQPIMGAGGIIPLVPEYAQRVQKMVRKMGGLYISDEVQTGFGRIGRQAWGFKWLGVKPDIVIIAKAIANGIPLAAIVTRRQIGQALSHQYYPSYAGGPLQMRIASEVLDIIREEKLAENAEQVGGFLLKQFQRIQKKSKVIGEVRGKGMMIACEFVKDQKTKQPNPEAFMMANQKGRQLGVLFGKGGHKGHILRMLGPLCISRSSAQRVVQTFDKLVDSMN